MANVKEFQKCRGKNTTKEGIPLLIRSKLVARVL